MIPYITYREDEDGVSKYFILQKEFPHYVGVITTVPQEGLLPFVPIAGYNLYVRCVGTLRGNMIPGYSDVMEEIKSECFKMANWFYENRILADEKRYRKFKIQSDV